MIVKKLDEKFDESIDGKSLWDAGWTNRAGRVGMFKLFALGRVSRLAFCGGEIAGIIGELIKLEYKK